MGEGEEGRRGRQGKKEITCVLFICLFFFCFFLCVCFRVDFDHEGILVDM